MPGHTQVRYQTWVRTARLAFTARMKDHILASLKKNLGRAWVVAIFHFDCLIKLQSYYFSHEWGAMNRWSTYYLFVASTFKPSAEISNSHPGFADLCCATLCEVWTRLNRWPCTTPIRSQVTPYVPIFPMLHPPLPLPPILNPLLQPLPHLPHIRPQHPPPHTLHIPIPHILPPLYHTSPLQPVPHTPTPIPPVWIIRHDSRSSARAVGRVGGRVSTMRGIGIVVRGVRRRGVDEGV